MVYSKAAGEEERDSSTRDNISAPDARVVVKVDVNITVPANVTDTMLVEPLARLLPTANATVRDWGGEQHGLIGM